jgi:hypothetical protein
MGTLDLNILITFHFKALSLLIMVPLPFVGVYVPKNSLTLTRLGLDRCQIIEYSGLSDGIYTDLSSYTVFLLLVLYSWAVQLIREVFHLDIHLLVQGHQGALFWSLCG